MLLFIWSCIFLLIFIHILGGSSDLFPKLLDLQNTNCLMTSAQTGEWREHHTNVLFEGQLVSTPPPLISSGSSIHNTITHRSDTRLSARKWLSCGGKHTTPFVTGEWREKHVTWNVCSTFNLVVLWFPLLFLMNGLFDEASDDVLARKPPRNERGGVISVCQNSVPRLNVVLLFTEFECS